MGFRERWSAFHFHEKRLMKSAYAQGCQNCEFNEGGGMISIYRSKQKDIVRFLQNKFWRLFHTPFKDPNPIFGECNQCRVSYRKSQLDSILEENIFGREYYNRSTKSTHFLTLSWLWLDKTTPSTLEKNKELREENYRMVRRSKKIESGALRSKTPVVRKPQQRLLGRSPSLLSRDISQPSSAISKTLEKALLNPQSYQNRSKN